MTQALLLPYSPGRMLSLLRSNPQPVAEPGSVLTVGLRQVPLRFIPNRRARRYVLRLTADGAARVTVPRGGSLAEARRFAQRNGPWLARQLQKLAAHPPARQQWRLGAEILLRGQPVKIEASGPADTGQLRCGSVAILVDQMDGDFRGQIERHLWKLAAEEFPPRVFELAALHHLPVRRVTVRNQRSRWGSCSRRGTISLNWRLIQAPAFVLDYLIFHELAHLRQMNHSARFWHEVERLCPNFRMAEQWLKTHSWLLHP